MIVRPQTNLPEHGRNTRCALFRPGRVGQTDPNPSSPTPTPKCKRAPCRALPCIAASATLPSATCRPPGFHAAPPVHAILGNRRLRSRARFGLRKCVSFCRSPLFSTAVPAWLPGHWFRRMPAYGQAMADTGCWGESRKRDRQRGARVGRGEARPGDMIADGSSQEQAHTKAQFNSNKNNAPMNAGQKTRKRDAGRPPNRRDSSSHDRRSFSR